MMPAERYRTDPSFAAMVDRCAGDCAVPVSDVLHELGQLYCATRPSLPSVAELAAAIAEQRAPLPVARRGPPVPPWARIRRR